VKPMPASAAGPSLRELVVGSEGVLGVITEATLAVRRLPRARRYEGWSFRSFAAGCDAFRALEHEQAAPDVARLSDEEETRMAMAMSSSDSLATRAGRAYLRARGHRNGCIVIVGWEGEQPAVAARAADGARILRAHGGLALGSRPGRAWLHSRYLGPYLRDVLLKPMLTVVAALIIAQAVMKSKKVENFLVPFIVAVWVMSVMAIGYVAAEGVSLGALALTSSRTFFSALGMHANDLGRLYAVAYALLLFTWGETKDARLKTILLLTMGVLTMALLFTFSRGAFVGWVGVNVLFLVWKFNARTLGLAKLTFELE